MGVDGHRSEGCWASAVPFPQGGLTVWAAWDPQALYLAFESKETRLDQLKANAREGEWAVLDQDDVVEWGLSDRLMDRTDWFLFNIKGKAASRQAQGPKPFPGEVRVVSERLKQAWKGEIRIPWKGLGVEIPPPEAFWLWMRRRGPRAAPSSVSPSWSRMEWSGKDAEVARSLLSIDQQDQFAQIEGFAKRLDEVIEFFHEVTGAYPPDSVSWPIVLRGITRQLLQWGCDLEGLDKKIDLIKSNVYEKEWKELWRALPYAKHHPFQNDKTMTLSSGEAIIGFREKVVIPAIIGFFSASRSIRGFEGVENYLKAFEKFSYRAKDAGYELVHPGLDGAMGTVDDFRSDGSMPLPHEDPAWFGVRIGPAPGGVIVRWVAKASPAEAVGLRVGDVITRIESQSLASPKAFGDLLAGYQKGSVVVLAIQRGTGPLELRVTLGH